MNERAYALARLLAFAAGAYVIGYPFLQAEHPPMTDLPFHAAQISILRHYGDPAFHFREQFTFDVFGTPYITMYALGALLAFLLPLAAAVKVAAATMLALVPVGLAVLFRGLKKSPLLGVLGLFLVWTDLAHWGFLSFIGAVGLQALSIGCALLLVEAPSRRRQIALGLALVATLFTHVYRFPFAVASVLLAAFVMSTSARTLRPLLAPLVFALVPFAAWLIMRPPELAQGLRLGAPDFGRLARFGEMIIGSYHGQAGATERATALAMLVTALSLAVLGAFWQRKAPASERRWRRRATSLVALLVLLHFGAFLTLPERAGAWWYVFPREAFTTALFALALVPDLPRSAKLQVLAVCVAALVSGRMALHVATQWRDGHVATVDFRAVSRDIPEAPKLFYLIFDHSGTSSRHSPFLHLPAWIQAQKGGWLGFHFAGWGIFPVRYRKRPNPAVPPAVPLTWEWTPQYFRVREHGAWFDTFLVRHRIDPAPLFAQDSSVTLVARRGDWWLYRRR